MIEKKVKTARWVLAIIAAIVFGYIYIFTDVITHHKKKERHAIVYIAHPKEGLDLVWKAAYRRIFDSTEDGQFQFVDTEYYEFFYDTTRDSLRRIIYDTTTPKPWQPKKTLATFWLPDKSHIKESGIYGHLNEKDGRSQIEN